MNQNKNQNHADRAEAEAEVSKNRYDFAVEIDGEKAANAHGTFENAAQVLQAAANMAGSLGYEQCHHLSINITKA